MSGRSKRPCLLPGLSLEDTLERASFVALGFLAFLVASPALARFAAFLLKTALAFAVLALVSSIWSPSDTPRNPTFTNDIFILLLCLVACFSVLVVFPVSRAVLSPVAASTGLFVLLVVASESTKRRLLRRRNEQDPRKGQGSGEKSIQEERVDALCYAFPFLTTRGAKKVLSSSYRWGTGGGRFCEAHEGLCAAIMGYEFGKDPWNVPQDDAGEAELDDAFHRHWLLSSALSGGPGGISPAQLERMGIPTPGTEETTETLGLMSYGEAETGAKTDGGHHFVPRCDLLLSEMWVANDRMRLWSDAVCRLAESRRGLSLAPLRYDNSNFTPTQTSLFECQCCFGDYPIESMVSCREEGHLFCTECVRRYAEERVFGLGSFLGNSPMDKQQFVGAETGNISPVGELTCMHGGGCSSGFPYEQLCHALPLKVLKQYDKLRASLDLDAAEIEGLSTCPKCEFRAILPSSEGVFRCPECHFLSCRRCRKEAHGNLRCSEVDPVRTRLRNRVEEAMTDAYIRTCPRPRCRRRFIKSDGCNKMRCVCGALACYVCRAEIPKTVGYDHFCRVPHCRHEACGKCPLFSNVEEDDARAVEEARQLAEAAAEQERTEIERYGEPGKMTGGPRNSGSAFKLPRGLWRFVSRKKKK